MDKYKYLFLGFFLGITIFGLGLYLFHSNSPTIVYKAKDHIQLESGIVIPKGAKLIQVRELSEGITTLALYINVWGLFTEELFTIEISDSGRKIIPDDEIRAW